MGCDYYIVTSLVVEYYDDNSGHNEIWDTLYEEPRYMNDYDEFIYSR